LFRKNVAPGLLKVSSIETRHLPFQRLPNFIQFGNTVTM